MANKIEGSVRQGWASVANNEYLDIRPPAPTSPAINAEEWRILSIQASGAVEVYKSNGTNKAKIDESKEFGFANFQWVTSRDTYYRVKNVSGTSMYIGYDAYVSMEES